MTEKNEYTQCLEAMYRLQRFGIILGLDTISGILSHLGNPQHRFRTIHVAGTNGKGSVASTLAFILNLAGLSTGLYTSPHLVRFNERICIDNRPVSDEAVLEAYKAVKNAPRKERELTFFEFSTAMAFHIFAEEKTEWAVIETGMGGRLDATNLINPELSVITNISLEHREYLGNSIEEITGEKGGIIKQNRPVVTGVRQESAAEVLRKIAAEKSAPLYRFGEAFRVSQGTKGDFTYHGIRNTWTDMRTGLSGRYQIDNAALVLAACEILMQNSVNIAVDHIREGLLRNRWPGRLEKVCQSPQVILDGAHNLDAARVLADYLKEETADRKIVMVMGILDDKPYREMMQYLLPLCRKVIICQAKTGRAIPAANLASAAKEIIADTQIIPDVGQALAHAMKTASLEDMICVAGSLYVVGEAKEHLEKQGIPSFRREA
ncbi:MAG: folylpolyglutamate synthase/dihydrofolate synthase family protein [Desulfococcaceae bacterium]